MEAILEPPKATQEVELQVVNSTENNSNSDSAHRNETDRRKTMPHLFRKGQSGNPLGRPKAFSDLRQGVLKFYAKDPLKCIQALYKERIDLFFAYGFGKPADRVELSGPDGGAIEVAQADVTALLLELSKRGVEVPK